MSRSAILVATLLLPALARAGGIAINGVADQVQMTANTAASGAASPIEVRGAGADLQRVIERAAAPVFVGHKMAEETRLPESEADISRLITEAHHRVILDGKVIPPPEIEQTLDHVSAMNDEGRAMVVDMPSNVMGLFHYDVKNDPRGEIKLNRLLMQVSMLVGDALAASVILHEGGHAQDEAIGGEDTVQSESRAFKRQFEYLRALYPTGEELATMRVRLREAYKKTPTLLNKVAMDFAATCDALWGMGRADGTLDEAKLGDFVRKLYKPDGSPASPSA